MAHPLFPFEPPEEAPEADDPRDISWIRVGRRTGNKGELEWVPKAFKPEELADLEAVHARWGGGTYVFVARDERNSRITARVNDEILPGPSKPLFDEPKAEEKPAPQPAAVAMPQLAGGALMQIAAFAGAITPLATALFGFLAKRGEADRMMMLELLGRSRSDQDTAAKTLIEASQANQKIMADFFTRLPQGGGGGSLEQLVTAIQLGQSLGQGQGGESDLIESMMALFGPVIQAKMAEGGNGGAPQLPPAPIPTVEELEAE